MTENPTVSIIIPNYNGKHFLADCFNSLSNQSYSYFEVIMVDNASSDGSVEFTTENFPKVKIIANSENRGFSKAVNQGAKLSKSEFLAILNNDTLVDSRWLEEFIEFTRINHDFGSCQSKILLYTDKEAVNTVGNEIFFLGQGWSGGYGKPEWLFNDIKEVTYCSGASMFIKRTVLEEVGYFDDEEVFMYHDDLDLGWRLLLYGYKNYLVPQSIVFHKYQYGRNRKKYYLLEVSRFVSIIKYYELKTIISILPAFLTLEFGVICYSLTGGWFKDKIKSYLYIIDNLQRLLIKRQQIQASRIISDKEISKYFRGKIDFKELNSILLKLVNPLFNIYWRLIRSLL